jgi:magnesium/cobalt transport protein CorA
MFRIIRIEGSSVEVRECKEVEPPPAGEKCWIDLVDFEPKDLELLRDRFQFHPLAIEDAGAVDQRAKAEEYGDHLFIVMHALTLGDGDGGVLQSEQLAALLSERYLVTVHRKPVKQLETVWRRAITDGTCASEGVDFMLYLIVDALIDDAFPIIDEISDRLEGIEAEIIDRVDQSQLVRLLELRRQFIVLRRTVAPHRDVVAMLVRRRDPRISDKSALYFRDVYDHVVRAYEEIDTERSAGQCHGSLHLHDGKSDQQHNEAAHDLRFDFPTFNFSYRVFWAKFQHDAVQLGVPLSGDANGLCCRSDRYAAVVPLERLVIGGHAASIYASDPATMSRSPTKILELTYQSLTSWSKRTRSIGSTARSWLRQFRKHAKFRAVMASESF